MLLTKAMFRIRTLCNIIYQLDLAKPRGVSLLKTNKPSAFSHLKINMSAPLFTKGDLLGVNFNPPSVETQTRRIQQEPPFLTEANSYRLRWSVV